MSAWPPSRPPTGPPSFSSQPSSWPRCGSPSGPDRKSTRLNSSHLVISYAVFCLKKKKKILRLTAYSRYDQDRLLHCMSVNNQMIARNCDVNRCDILGAKSH